jgi:outer membrane protein OmpA-like peptidoglycan-associated protein
MALLGAFAATSVDAQVVVGGNKRPAVLIDDSVLDRLGPAPTLPQLFLGARGLSHVARPTATASRTTPGRSRTMHTAGRRSAPHRAPAQFAQAAPARTQSSLNQIIHLTPPGTRVASAPPPAPFHDQAAVSAPTQPAIAALAAPAPGPGPRPQPSSDAPAPVLPPPPARQIAPPPQAATTPTPPAAPAATAAPTPMPMPVTTAAATAPAPVAAPPAPSPPPVQMAAATTVGAAMSAVKFNAGATDLARGPQPTLDAVAARLLGNDNLRVQVIAHATGSADDAMEARRVSLARAVAVRAYLIDKGVRSLRIDVRALGNRSDGGPVADQVDLLVVSQ